MTDTTAPETARVRRTRVRRGYSRKGCARCKQQRVRCDEQQPQCGRCVRAGAECPGYELKIRWSAKHEVFWTPPARETQTKTAVQTEVQTEVQTPLQTQIQTQLEPSPAPPALPPGPQTIEAAFDALTPPPLAGFDSGAAVADSGSWPEVFDPLFALPAPDSADAAGMAMQQPPGPGIVHWPDAVLEAPDAAPWPLPADADNDDDIEYIERTDQAPASPASRALGLPSSSAAAAASAAAASAAPPLTASLTDVGTVLVEFYFKVTAQIYSCYDGQRNPFRTAVTRLWDSSRILYCTLQSMAAASLEHDFPAVAPLGRQLRREAEALVAQAAVWDARTVLAVLMLGGSAGWHDFRDVGLPHFNRMAAYLAAPGGGDDGDGDGDGDGNGDDHAGGTDVPDSNDTVAAVSPRHRNGWFLREAMLFWAMNMAFVTDEATYAAFPPIDEQPILGQGLLGQGFLDQGLPSSMPPPPSPSPPPPPPPLEPHPWTGFGTETMRAMLHVGQLVRRQRRTARARARLGLGLAADDYAAQAQAQAQAQRDLAAAAALEAWLVRMRLPDEAAVRDTGDRNAPAWHLLALARVMRDAALVQLYHVFPALLRARMGAESAGGSAGGSAGAWLTAFALRSLATLQTVPAESGTCDFQPFMMVALSSELRIARPAAAATAVAVDAVDLGLDMATVEVTRARGFVQGRLATFLRVLPPRPMEVCLALVQETWRQMDQQALRRQLRQQRFPGRPDPEPDVYWMDVMMDNGWEAILA